MKRLAILFACVLTACSAFAQPAPAKKDAARPRQIRGPCAEDAVKFCKEVQPGGGRVVACLEVQGDKLSPGCKAQITQTQQRRQERQKKGPPAAPAKSAVPETVKKEANKK